MRVQEPRHTNVWAKVLISIGVLIVISMEYVRPWIVGELYSKEYKLLALECDSAMHEEVSIRFSEIDSDKQRLLVKSADVGLIVCHEYDKLRKKMLNHGVTEDQLALYGLEALEIESVPVGRMVDPHRMPRF